MATVYNTRVKETPALYNNNINKISDFLIIIFNTPATFYNSILFKRYYYIVLPLLIYEKKIK